MLTAIPVARARVVTGTVGAASLGIRTRTLVAAVAIARTFGTAAFRRTWRMIPTFAIAGRWPFRAGTVRTRAVIAANILRRTIAAIAIAGSLGSAVAVARSFRAARFEVRAFAGRR